MAKKAKKKAKKGRRKKPKTINVAEYYDALSKEFLIGAQRSRALQQLLKRGENDEKRIKRFLEDVLPKRFAVGEGFLISSNPGLGVSPHMEVVIYDEFQNAPLYRELSSSVFPVESVYATVEIKRVLRKDNLQKIAEDSAAIRTLGGEKFYTAYVPVKVPGTENVVTGGLDYRVTKLKPRSFLVAIRQKGWQSIEELASDLVAATQRFGGHLHGVVVIESDWHLHMVAYPNEGRAPIKYSAGNSLLKFTQGLMHSLAGFRMGYMSVNKYLKVDAPEFVEPEDAPQSEREA